MRNKACVINFEKENIWVTPLLSDTCINCSSHTCEKRGKPFKASNPKKLELSCGDIVKIGSSVKAQVTQGFIALFFPILAAFGGYISATPIAQIFNKTATEGLKALLVILCFFITTTIITILSRCKLNLAKPEIISVIGKGNQTNENHEPTCL